jgi:hypothetical protein
MISGRRLPLIPKETIRRAGDNWHTLFPATQALANHLSCGMVLLLLCFSIRQRCGLMNKLPQLRKTNRAD